MDLQMAYLYTHGIHVFFIFGVSLLVYFIMDGMKKLGVVLCLCVMMGLSVMANNPSLVRVDGRRVDLPEFLWYFNRAGGGDVEQYFQRFLQFQLKVADARRLQLDTLSDFRRQSDFLKARVLKKFFMNRQLTDSYYQQLTERLASRHTEKKWVRMDVFTYRLSQHASAMEERNAVRVMNEWMQRLLVVGVPRKDELKWAQMKGIVAQQQTDEWIPINRLLKEIVKHQANLPLGSWSKPFESPLGIHVVRVVERRNKAGNEWFPELQRYTEQQEKVLPIFDRDAYERWAQGNEQLPSEVLYELTSADEGLLATYWELYHQDKSEENKKISPALLEAYFRRHKEDYQWEYPHFKGAVIHCRNKKAASKIKKKLKKIPMDRWEEALNKLQQEDPKCSGQLECGLFQIGKNAYVDRLAFKCGNFSPHQEFPYTLVVGKKLKKGPEDYTDVLAKVTTDYLRQHENDRFSQLFARFNVEINKDVLKTVNSCGNK